ncbi:hypothetical protein [Mucilaginibacter sp. OK098]|uniref:hypothetical protein n=1 Tax=Mucilaginibacter sp. OK098 TaxID=1855297 RepID=UPI0009219060|nr:hypothetical protein [Mucilaginibacter sp. OK098]SHM93167.1 hypothetical protein SAMN05216524_104161 [Mucilaginibacter sp. OK098]
MREAACYIPNSVKHSFSIMLQKLQIWYTQLKASILSMLENAKLKFSFLKLGMAGEFTERAEKLGLLNLGDLMSVNLAKLKAHRDFNYIWYAEMLRMLKSQGLLHEFQKRTLEA